MEKSKKILLIEDDPLIADIYLTNLKKNGFEIGLATDGETGYKMAEEGKFDLILLDLLLPKIDGFKLLEKIKGNRSLKDTPVIILTNLGEKESIEKGKEMGAIDYLVKVNFTPKEVIEKINSYLR
ncbi:MAG: response regulator [Patescibacteria group bacterium]